MRAGGAKGGGIGGGGEGGGGDGGGGEEGGEGGIRRRGRIRIRRGRRRWRRRLAQIERLLQVLCDLGVAQRRVVTQIKTGQVFVYVVMASGLESRK